MRPRLTILAAAIGAWVLPVHEASSTDTVPDVPAPPSWTSPLSSPPMSGYRNSQSSDRPNFRLAPVVPLDAGPAAQWITRAALLALSTTGKISGTGRETTGDIGKPPLGINNDPYASPVPGGIR